MGLGEATTAAHQVARLAAGRHESPEDGVCVMELASMLAGERFSDHPGSVCPVIGSFMRNVNDRVPEDALPDLYPYAAAIVGTHGRRRIRRARARACMRWARSMGEAPTPFRGAVGLWAANQDPGTLCAKAALRHGGTSLALTLADALIALGDADRSDAAIEPEAAQLGFRRLGSQRHRPDPAERASLR